MAIGMRYAGRSVMGARSAAALAIAAGTIVGASGVAHGAILNWTNAAGGSAGTAGNWSPAQVPAAADTLVFNTTAGVQSYGVTFAAATPASTAMTFNQDNVTLTMSAPHTTSGALSVGVNSGEAPGVTLTTGLWNVGGAVTIGQNTGSAGTLNVNDDDADLAVTGAASDMTVGSNGNGTLAITAGGLVVVPDQFLLGSGSTSVAGLTVSGATSTLPLVRSTLQVNGASQSRFGAGGDATVSIANGGLADFAGDLVVSNGSASTSAVTIAGFGGVIPTRAKLDVAGDLLLGHNTGGAAAGAATMNVNAGGDLVVGGTLFVAGDPDGGTAVLHTEVDANVDAGSIEIGTGATLDLDDGTIDINGGTFANTTGAFLAIPGGAGNPVVTMRSGASGTLPSFSGNSLRLGSGAGANAVDFDVRTGSDLTCAANLFLGDGTDDIGRMTVNGVGSTLTVTTSNLVVGFTGQGRLEAELGGAVTAAVLEVGMLPGSDGFVLVESPGSVLSVFRFDVGGSGSNAGGSGRLSVSAGGTMNVTGSFPCVIWPGGVLEVAQTGANLNALNATLDVRGELEVEDGGLLNAAQIIVRNGGSLSGPTNIAGAATINARTRIESGGTLELVSGDLTVGSVSASDGFNAQVGSTVSVGAHTLTLHDQNLATVDSVTINGGRIVAPNGLEIVPNGDLVGTGTIDGIIAFIAGGGTVTATGTDGITINGRLSNPFGGCGGTKFTFTNGDPISGWAGAGAINARVEFRVGTQVIAVANMTMGNSSMTDGVIFETATQMHLNSHAITLLDSNSVVAAALTDMDGGTLSSVNGLHINPGAVLRGHGTINCPSGVLNLNGPGTIDPDDRSGADGPYDGVGGFSVNGGFAMAPTSTYLFETAGYNSEFQQQCDVIDVNGHASLNGTLNVSFILGYTPSLCDEFTVMRYDSRSGVFANVNLPPGVTGGVRYEATRAVLFFNSVGCDGIDFNNDGLFPDNQDLEDFLSVFGGGNCGNAGVPCSDDIDFNNDCLFPDNADIEAYFNVFGGGTC